MNKEDRKDLVERLRNVTEDDAYALPWTFGETCREAADEITRLRRELEEARKALAQKDIDQGIAAILADDAPANPEDLAPFDRAIAAAKERLTSRASASADTDSAQSGGEAFDKIVAARKAHIDAVAAYNARLEFVRAERERGNWLNVDPEYAAMSEGQSAFYRTVQELADAAIRQRAEEETP